MKTRVYEPRPLKYREWLQIRKELLLLIAIAAAVYLVAHIIEAITWTLATMHAQ